MRIIHRIAIVGLATLVQAGSACTIFNEQLPSCRTNLECTQKASAGSSTEVPAVCVGEGFERQCQNLLSADCYKVTAGTGATGDTNDAYKNDQAIVIGSLFETGGIMGTGSTGQTNQRREESAILAVQEFNTAHGIPGPSLDTPHPLVMVSCDTSMHLRDPGGAAEHLIDKLHVPAIIGPNQSQDVLDLTPYSAPRHTALLSPTGVASSIADLEDNGFTFQMVPNDLQRARLMNDQITLIESQIRPTLVAADQGNVRMAVLFRDDALGQGTQRALNSLLINGHTLAEAPNRNQAVLIFGYDATDTSKDAAILSQLLTLKPHIVVLAGNQEVVTRFVTGSTVTPPAVKLEEMWDASVPRPFYVGIDSTKNSTLFGAAKNTMTSGASGNQLRVRVRGTGVTPGADSLAVYTQFITQYLVKFPTNSSVVTVSGPGSAYDAVYAAALAIAASGDAKTNSPVTGDSVKRGLPFLTGGTTLNIEQSTITSAFQHFNNGEHINAVGVFGPLAWKDSGAKQGGTIEVWCLRQGTTANGNASGQSTSARYDVATDTLIGTYDGTTQCP